MMKPNRAVKNLRRRVEMLSARTVLLEQYTSLGLTQTDIVNALGENKSAVSNYFAGRLDSEDMDNCVKRLISSRGVAV
ncbi:MAG: hypothetical protein AB7F25_12265 [Deferribacterales bacterium]